MSDDYEERENEYEADDVESQEEQTFEDEYEDRTGESTAPTREAPGVTVKRFRDPKTGRIITRAVPVIGEEGDTPLPKRKLKLIDEEDETPKFAKQLEKARKATKKPAGKKSKK